MPHSVKQRKKRERVTRDLNKRVKELKKLKTKHYADAEIIVLPNVSLGDLRDKYKYHHHPLHPAVVRSVPKFTRIPINKDRPLLIYGSDGGLLVARIPLKRQDLVTKLSESIDRLPEKTRHYTFRGINRSEYKTRHYGVWASYQPLPFITAEHKDDGPIADAFLEENAELFHVMSGALGELAPGVFKEFQRYPIPDLERACGAWSACVVNNGGNNPNQTEVHRDVRESQYGYSCVVTCGEFTKGASILYDLGYVIELAPGDLELFPDSLIHHANEEAEGVRKSLVTFTQENMNDYWHREFGMILKRHLRKAKKKEKIKAQKLQKKEERRLQKLKEKEELKEQRLKEKEERRKQRSR